MIKVAPSILSGDFSRLGEEVRRLEAAEADWVHVDVMDGMFVPNITVGPGVLRDIRPHCSLPFDVHLMIMKPERYIQEFATSGADIITVHVEASVTIGESLRTIRALGKEAGLSLNPETPVEHVLPYLEQVQLLLVMSVHPGFGGQSFMPDALPKLERLAKLKEENGFQFEIEVDGGINLQTGKRCVEAGATVLAAGSALFKAADLAKEIERWKRLGRQ